MKLFRVPPLLLLCWACIATACSSDDGPSAGTETPDTSADATDDLANDALDATDDDATTPEPDSAEPDVAPETGPAPDDTTTDPPDADDVDEADAVEDTVEDVPEEDTGPVWPTCSTTADCEGARLCLEGICQIPLAGLQIVEDSFAITEPSEVRHVFNIIKDLAVDIRFMMIDVRPEALGSGRVPARYGSVDLVDVDATPVQVAWQDLPVNPSVLFEPLRDEDGMGDGTMWRTLPFDLSLLAFVTFDFAGFGSFSGEIGFEALDVVLDLTLDEEGTTTQLIMRGNFTVEEAQSRFMATYEDFRSLIPLICRSNRNYVPETEPGRVPVMRLWDVLECNGAVPDVDLNGDGEMDAYYTEIIATMVPAELVERE